jgi:hypothetical protein
LIKARKLDGVYRCGADSVPTFVEVDTPTDGELHALLQPIIPRLTKPLTRRGVLLKDIAQTCVAKPDADGNKVRTLRALQAAAVTYRVAFGPHAGQKVPALRGAMCVLEFMQRLAAPMARSRLHPSRTACRSRISAVGYPLCAVSSRRLLCGRSPIGIERLMAGPAGGADAQWPHPSSPQH